MALTLLDGIVIVVVLISAILAMARGFLREVLSLAAWLIAAAAAYFFYQPLMPLLTPYIENETVAAIVAAAVIFFVALIVASYITMKISDLLIEDRVGFIDRVLGFLFGAARGLLILVIAYIGFDALVADMPPEVSQARLHPLIQDLSGRLSGLLPEDLEQNIRRLRGEEPAPAPDPQILPPLGPPAVIPTDAAGPGAGYGNGVRNGLDQLIDNAAAAR